MAVRLSVLVLRPPGGGSTWHAHSDDLLGHLLGRPGFDVTLLERLPAAGEDSTETLALESIGGHVACLAWQDAADVVADLERAGRPMVRRPHDGDPDCADAAAPVPGLQQASVSVPQGRMFLYDMRHQGRTEAVLGALQKLLQTLQVSTFQIGPPAHQVAGRRPLATSPRQVEIAERPANSSQAPISVAATSKLAATTIRSEPRTLHTDAGVASTQPDALDRLVDELDAFDS